LILIKNKKGVKMNIISWKPKPKVSVNDIDSVLDSFFQNDWSFEKKQSANGNWTPSVDISENEKNVFIITELAGVSKSDLTITFSENQLKMSKCKTYLNDLPMCCKVEILFWAEYPNAVLVDSIHQKYLI